MEVDDDAGKTVSQRRLRKWRDRSERYEGSSKNLKSKDTPASEPLTTLHATPLHPAHIPVGLLLFQTKRWLGTVAKFFLQRHSLMKRGQYKKKMGTFSHILIR